MRDFLLKQKQFFGGLLRSYGVLLLVSGLVFGMSTSSVQAADDMSTTIFAIFYSFVITVFGWLFVQGAWLFDFGINEFLLGFGDLYYNHNVGVAVEMTWGIIRDLFNLSLIFGMVYIGFKMILDSDDSHGQKMLVHLISAALLVNFSLFIIKFLIDISDITTLVIAHGFNVCAVNGVCKTSDSIANTFINILQLGTLFSVKADGITSLDGGGGFAYIVGIMIFLATAAFVFAAGGILLIVRFVVLNIYLVFSPVMFIGWVFPQFEHQSKKYMEGFLGQAFFAPAYLLMLYLSYKVLAGYAKIKLTGTAAAGLGNAFTDPSTMSSIIPFFVLAMIFLVASLVVAKNMGAVGASTMIKVGNQLRGVGQRAIGASTFGVAAYGLQRGIGGQAKERLDDKNYVKSKLAQGWTGKMQLKAMAKVADSSFDARRVNGAGKALGIGEGKKGGYATRLKERDKAEKAFLEDIVGKFDAEKDSAVLDAKVAEKNAKDALAEKRYEISIETASERSEIKNLSNEFKTATESRKLEIATKMNALKAKIDIKEKEIEVYEDNFKTATANVKAATAKAEYANQLMYIERLKAAAEQERKWTKIAVTAAGVAGTGAAMLATGGILAPAFIGGAGIGTGLLAARGNYKANQKNIKSLGKEYGNNGLNKVDSEHKKHNLKILAEEMEHSGVGGHSAAPSGGGHGGGGGQSAPSGGGGKPAAPSGGGGHH